MVINSKPNPTGNDTYGAFRPNVKAHATALRSIFIRFITTNKGGIKIGMKAMCTGIKFCEKQDTKAMSNVNATFFVPTIFVIFLVTTVANPERPMTMAKAPNKI